jgi:pre-mRNA-processing factor 6
MGLPGARLEVREEAEPAKHHAERPKQFADLKRGLSVVTYSKRENIPEVGNLTRRKSRRDERTFAVPDNAIVWNRAKWEYENSLDCRLQVRA